MESLNGNHVLQKAVTYMPPYTVEFIVEELSFFSGGWVAVAKHRFGCRLVQRLLEHCELRLVAPIAEAVVQNIDDLSRHPQFGNNVVQHVLQYVPEYRGNVVHALIQAGVPRLAMDQTASVVIECAWEYSEHQTDLAEAVLSRCNAMESMARNRWGRFTVWWMLKNLPDPLRCRALQQLEKVLQNLDK